MYIDIEKLFGKAPKMKAGADPTPMDGQGLTWGGWGSVSSTEHETESSELILSRCLAVIDQTY